METIVPKVLGVYFMVSGVFVMTHKKTLAKILQDLLGNRGMSLFVGFVLLIGGVSLVLSASTATPLIIKIISWAILLKGLMYMFAPEWWMRSAVRIVSTQFYSLVGVLAAAVGVYLYFFL